MLFDKPEHLEEAEPRMLYHYTPVERLPAIRAQGLRGNAPPQPRTPAKPPVRGAVYAMTFVTPGRLRNIVLVDLAPAISTRRFVVLRFVRRGRWLPDPEVNEPRGCAPSCVWRRKPIPPEEIEVAYRNMWVRLCELESL